MSTQSTATTGAGVTAARLKRFIERLERLDAERRETVEQARELLKLRKMKPHDRAEQEELLETYKTAIGMAP